MVGIKLGDIIALVKIQASGQRSLHYKNRDVVRRRVEVCFWPDVSLREHCNKQ